MAVAVAHRNRTTGTADRSRRGKSAVTVDLWAPDEWSDEVAYDNHCSKSPSPHHNDVSGPIAGLQNESCYIVAGSGDIVCARGICEVMASSVPVPMTREDVPAGNKRKMVGREGFYFSSHLCI